MRRLVLALSLASTHAVADPGKKLTLDEVIAKAVGNPQVQMALSDADAASARVDEADAARLPHVKLTGYATISPEIRCQPVPSIGAPASECLTTEPSSFAFKFSGFFETAELDLTQPLYTFGKIQHARAAARAGLDAQTALANEAAGDVAVDAATAYWGLKVSRELGGMLDDGIEEIEKAKKDFEAKTDATIQDRQRVAVLYAEAKAQRTEVAALEGQAFAGLKAITNDRDADIDDAEIAAVDRPVPELKSAVAAADHRPQRLAAKAGAVAGSELAELQHASYFPDIALAGTAAWSHADGVDSPPTAFAYDPYRNEGLAAVIGLQWTLEPWNTHARTARALADAHKLAAQAQLADLGARYDAATAQAQAAAAHDRVAAATQGEKAARTWLAAVLQNEAIGTAESRDLADAYLAYFQMHARWARAVMDWNVAVVRLGRATGEYRAGANRPK